MVLEKRICNSIETLKVSAKSGELKSTAGVLLVGGIAGAVATPIAGTATISALGLGAGGIVAGSWAAGAMAASGGAVASGGAIATLQSAGATGSLMALGAGPVVLIVIGGAVVVGGASVGPISWETTSRRNSMTQNE